MARVLGSNPLSALESMFRALEIFRQTEKAPTGQRIEVFLLIASSNDLISQREIGDRMNIKDGTVSGHVAGLSDADRYRDGSGMGLIQASPDPDHGGRRLWRLTRKGQRLAERMAEALRGRGEE